MIRRQKLSSVLSGLFSGALVIASATALGALADEDISRCDCSVVMAKCSANIGLSGDNVVIRSDVPQCSQVMWYAGSLPHVTTVLGGLIQQKWPGEWVPELNVQSCQVCKDTMAAKAEFKDGAENRFYRYTDPRTGRLRYLELPPGEGGGNRKIIVP
ncbi:MAG: hypothetical protein K6L73_00535 [Cellvibrionaceae bacterium]